eukprot:CAMPEP_0172828346 /NCGR_PEP_ID=MMETSP1075-20121228/20781_1 /TAXON_ID=2916 /ORGANISM="Ceratium fusus, Strain PA161109" /LENGTH=32 /DNA_ID= /DNA_START= /DNA_END= /DNA_ORIENTATION=
MAYFFAARLKNAAAAWAVVCAVNAAWVAAMSA